MAGAGNREVARCGRGHIAWQAQYFVRVGGVDAQIFAGVAGNREVASCDGGDCRWDWRVSRRCLGGAGIAKLLAGLLDVCAPTGLPA